MFRIHCLLLLAGTLAYAQTSSPRKLITSMEGKDLYFADLAGGGGGGGSGGAEEESALHGGHSIENEGGFVTFLCRWGRWAICGVKCG